MDLREFLVALRGNGLVMVSIDQVVDILDGGEVPDLTGRPVGADDVDLFPDLAPEMTRPVSRGELGRKPGRRPAVPGG